MKTFNLIACLLCALMGLTQAWMPHPVGRAMPSVTTRSTTTRNAAEFVELTSIVQAAAEGVKPGSVDAPGWVAPVGGIVVILTAALPVLLSPGEEALEKMREQEEGEGFKFRK